MLDVCCCWWCFVLEVGVGDLGCLDVLPLRRMGAEEEDAIGRKGCCRNVVPNCLGEAAQEVQMP